MEKMMSDSVRADNAWALSNPVRGRRKTGLLLAAATLCACAPIARAQNTPIALNGWNADLIGSSSGTNWASSVSGDSNTSTLLSATNNEVLYSQGLSAAGLGSGTFTSLANTSAGVHTSTTFQLQSFTANNALLLSPQTPSATLNLSNPSAFSSLSILIASFDSSQNTAGYFTYGFQPNTNTSSGSNFYGTPNYFWDNPNLVNQTATTNLGMLNISNGVTSAAPAAHLYEVVVNPLSYSGKLISSITFTSTSSNPYAVFAVSGTAASLSAPLTYKGAVSSNWNTTDANWYNTSAGINSTPIDYVDNAAVTFDETATGSTNINIAGTGVKPLSVTFNNSSKTYNFSGGAIGGSTGMNLNGSGTVILNNTNTFTGTVNLKSGKLIIGPSGALASPFQFVNIASGATLELDGNSNLASTILENSGVVHVIGANVTGIFSFTTGLLTIDSGSSFNCDSGAIDGTVNGGGTLILSNSLSSLGTPVAGLMILELPTSLQCNANVSGGSAIIVGDAQSAQNNMTAGLVGSTPLLLTLSGTGNLANKTSTANGALLGADYSSDAWAGNINVSGSTYISGGNNGTLTISGVIKGASTAAVGFSSDQSSTTVLAAVNTYTGETQVVAPAGSSGTLQLGINNAINSASGLNLTGAGYNYFDLNGFNVSVAYLTSNASAGSCTITNSSSSPATLTVVQKAGTNTYIGQINGPISLVFSGTGNQTLTNNNTYSGGTTINAGTVTAASTAALGSGPITINGGGLIFQSTDPATVFAMLQSGYNGGSWNGTTGINSTAAAAAADGSHLHAVGMLQPSTATTFEGQTLGTGDVAVKYTYYGDTNLDGKVDGSDYSRVDIAYIADESSPAAVTGWYSGDFNYDGTVNGSDYTLMDNAFNTQGARLTAAVATAQIAGTSAVPEPAGASVLAITALGVLGRRRRHLV